MKDRARVMIKMATAINTEYLTQLTDPKPEHPVTCGTCHQVWPSRLSSSRSHTSMSIRAGPHRLQAAKLRTDADGFNPPL